MDYRTDEPDALLTEAAKAVALGGHDWQPEDVEVGELRGTLPFDCARAALGVAGDLTAWGLNSEEARTILLALYSWGDARTEGVARKLGNASGDERRQVLEDALAHQRLLEGLVARAQGWVTTLERAERDAQTSVEARG